MENLKIDPQQLETIHNEIYGKPQGDSPISIQLRKLDQGIYESTKIKNYEVFDNFNYKNC